MKRKVPYETYLLAAMLIFLSFMSIFGGISLLIDSTGSSLGLKIDEYINYPFQDFFLPAVLLLLLFGIIPLLLIYPLFKKPENAWANIFNIYKRRHWAWTYSIYLGMGLIIWINAQIFMLGFISNIQLQCSLWGLAIVIVCLLPKQMRFFTKQHSTHRHHNSENKLSNTEIS